MYENLFVVDVEATSPTPMTGVMTEFAAVHVITGAAFYAHLYDFTPHPDIPALPVVVLNDDGTPRSNPYWDIHTDPKLTARRGRHPRLDRVVTELEAWLKGFNGISPRLVSDNNGFDAMWLNCFTDQQAGKLLFGHSSRRIGDFYAGVSGEWSNQSAWKKLRQTKHTHDPLDDARGNAEALRVILGVDPR